jgi:hypothetical protein
MILQQLCPPALLYVAFSLTQIIIDIFKNMYNTAFFKFIVTIIFTIVLNTLCKQGLGIISWFIVFVPFIMMSIITTLLLFAFGLSPSSGKLNYNVKYPDSETGLNREAPAHREAPQYQYASTDKVVKSINDVQDDDNNNNSTPIGSSESKIQKIKIIRHKVI